MSEKKTRAVGIGPDPLFDTKGDAPSNKGSQVEGEEHDFGEQSRRCTVSADHGPMRADEFVRTWLNISHRETKTLFFGGGVYMGTRKIARGDRLNAGDEIAIHIHQEKWLNPSEIAGWNLHCERSDYLVVNKPAGIHCHPLRRGEGETLLDAVAFVHPEVILPGEDEREGGLCHRLDFGTSGLLVFARSAEAKKKLRALWGTPQVQKGYLALVNGQCASSVCITDPIAHHPSREDRMVVPSGQSGFRGKQQMVTTRVRTLSRSMNASLVAISIEAGARHQIRVHLSHIGHPLFGDILYGGPPLKDRDGFFLHSAYLRWGPGDAYGVGPPRAFKDAADELDLLLLPEFSEPDAHPPSFPSDKWDF